MACRGETKEEEQKNRRKEVLTIWRMRYGEDDKGSQKLFSNSFREVNCLQESN